MHLLRTFAVKSAAFFAAVLLALCFIQAAGAAGNTGTTHQFYGTVTGHKGLVGAGYVVTAVVDGQQVASTVTDANGQWGYSPLFIVTAPASTTIEFYVNSVLSGTAAGCISTNRMDLVYNDPQLVSGTSASSGTAPANTISGRQTITFFIGQQASTNTPAATPSASTPSTTTASVALPAAVPVASITATELAVEPETVEQGSPVSISVKVFNKGNVDFIGGAVLRINGAVEEQKGVNLPVGQSCTVTYIIYRNEPGEYSATIDDLSTRFIVKEKQAAAVPQATGGQPAGPEASQQSTTAGNNNSNKLIPDSPLLAWGVIIAGVILAIYLISVIIHQGRRY